MSDVIVLSLKIAGQIQSYELITTETNVKLGFKLSITEPSR